jgi:DNA-binding HxlR family transcriptional regulator
MRSYRQFCPAAKTLDVIGDRWSLLIVRELLTRRACRYTDLLDGLPGIATNLLAARLRELEESGVVRREKAPPPVATTLFMLTERGEQLEPVLDALGRWGAPRLRQPTEGDSFRSHWLLLPLRLLLRDRSPEDPPASIEVRTGEQPLVIDVGRGKVGVRLGTAEEPAVVIAGSPRLVLGLLAGGMDLSRARSLGLTYEGRPDVLARVRPEPLSPVEGQGPGITPETHS